MSRFIMGQRWSSESEPDEARCAALEEGEPGEVFVELGLAIEQRSPFSYTFVVSLANDNIG